MTGTISRSSAEHSNPWRFFVLALSLSWLFWIPLALLGKDPMAFPYIIPMILGGLGPAIAEAILVFGLGSEQQKREYWHRVFDIRRISLGWLAVILLMFPILNAVATLLSVMSGSPLPAFETVHRLLGNPISVVPYVIFLFFFGPFFEELGWSGYALDGLQSRWSALTSSLIIGLVWAVWHLPLFFMRGTFQSEQIGFATANFWWYILPTLPISVLDTWIYNNANRSTLAAALLHFMVNFSGELFELTERARSYQALLIAITTLAIILIWGPKTLTREAHERDMVLSDAVALS